MSTVPFDPYRIYNLRPDYDDPTLPPPSGPILIPGPPNKPGPVDPDFDPAGKRKKKKTGKPGYTQGGEYPGKKVPYPSDRDRQLARGDIEGTDEEIEAAKERLAAWREYAAEKGAWEVEQLSSGIIPKMKISRLNMLSNYGSDFANLDLANRKKWDPRGGGKWVDLTPGEYDEIMRYRTERDSPRNVKFQRALGLSDTGRGYDPRFAAVGVMRGLNETARAGHIKKDPKTGYYYSVRVTGTGPGQPNEDPNSWDWFDQFGRPVGGPPRGYSVSSNTTGILPNRYELNTPGVNQNYPYPGQPYTPPTPSPFPFPEGSPTPSPYPEPGQPYPTGSTTMFGGTSPTYGSSWGGASLAGSPTSKTPANLPGQTVAEGPSSLLLSRRRRPTPYGMFSLSI